jgi:hypothetical protein
MDEEVRAAFLFAEPETLEDGSRWNAGFAEWDPYRHMTLTMDVSLMHADGRVEHFEHSMGVPDGIGPKDREQVREALTFTCNYRAGIFEKRRAAREAAEREAEAREAERRAAEEAAEREAAEAAARQAAEARVWGFELLTKGLPNPDGTVTHPGRTYRFPCATRGTGQWVIGVPSVQEDSAFWAPEDWDQLAWVQQQHDLTGELRWDNAAELTDAEAFELVERMGACVVGQGLEARYVEAGGDVIAPPSQVAASIMHEARVFLGSGNTAKAFDLATRMLASREQRVHARRLRAEILWRFGCVEDARIEGDRVRLLGGPPNEAEWANVPPGAVPALVEARAVAMELQGLPLEGGGVEGHLVRYLFRVEVTPGAAGATVAPIARWSGVQGEVSTQLPEQAEWLSRVTGVSADSQCQWTLPSDRAVVDFVFRAERCLRGRSARDLVRLLEKSLAPG